MPMCGWLLVTGSVFGACGQPGGVFEGKTSSERKVSRQQAHKENTLILRHWAKSALTNRLLPTDLEVLTSWYAMPMIDYTALRGGAGIMRENTTFTSMVLGKLGGEEKVFLGDASGSLIYLRADESLESLGEVHWQPTPIKSLFLDEADKTLFSVESRGVRSWRMEKQTGEEQKEQERLVSQTGYLLEDTAILSGAVGNKFLLLADSEVPEVRLFVHNEAAATTLSAPKHIFALAKEAKLTTDSWRGCVAMALSPTARLMAVAHERGNVLNVYQSNGEGKVCVLSFYGEKVWAALTKGGKITCLRFNQAGNSLFVGLDTGYVGGIYLPKVRKDAVPCQPEEMPITQGDCYVSFTSLHDTPITCLLVSPDDGTVVAGGANGQVCLLDSYALIGFPFLMQHRSAVVAMAFRAGGSELLFALKNGTLVRWWLPQDKTYARPKLHLLLPATSRKTVSPKA